MSRSIDAVRGDVVRDRNPIAAVVKHYTSPKIRQMLKGRRRILHKFQTFRNLRNGPEFAPYIVAVPRHNHHTALKELACGVVKL